jgi:hypothetical protein
MAEHTTADDSFIGSIQSDRSVDNDNYKELARKWRHGINLNSVRADEITEFLDTKLFQYVLYEIVDDNLWELFRHDFKDFTCRGDFNRFELTEMLRLRKTLRCGGVFVQQNGGTNTIANTLHTVMKEDEQHVWSNEDILAARPDLIKGPILSGFITLTKNKRLEPVIFDIPTPSPPLPPPPPPHPTPPPDLRTGTEAPGANGTLPPLPPPPPQPYPNNPQFPSTARLIGEVAKIYTEEQKYDGSNGNFDHKLTIFLDICQRVELPQEALMRAFPTMLKGLAQDHFYSNQLSQRTYEEACINIRSFFEGPGFERRNLDKWNATTLASVTAKFPEKTTFETVQLLINELRQLQYGLTPNLRNTEFLHNKIITSCQGSRAYRYAISDPPANLGQLINKLQSSITTYESE